MASQILCSSIGRIPLRCGAVAAMRRPHLPGWPCRSTTRRERSGLSRTDRDRYDRKLGYVWWESDGQPPLRRESPLPTPLGSRPDLPRVQVVTDQRAVQPPYPSLASSVFKCVGVGARASALFTKAQWSLVTWGLIGHTPSTMKQGMAFGTQDSDVCWPLFTKSFVCSVMCLEPG